MIGDSYDTVRNAVIDFWKETYPQDVIVFFNQKYEFDLDEDYEWCQELASPQASDDYENVIFNSDFCEGQTWVKDIQVVPLNEIVNYYVEHKPVRRYIY
jgi:hypothetical protein